MTVFLPCRAGSERIPHKNTKAFAGIEGGLVRLKLQTLLTIEDVDLIVVSTNDFEVIRIAESFENTRIQIDLRPEHLATSATSTDDLINYVPNIVAEDDIIWTHVTSPFLTKKSLINAIQIFKEDNEFDSVMSVNKVQTFLWSKTGAVNYDRSKEKWPRTQTIEPLYEINSGFFISKRSNYLKLNDRIGNSPYLFATSGYESLDVDWPEDFELAEMIYKQKINK